MQDFFEWASGKLVRTYPSVYTHGELLTLYGMTSSFVQLCMHFRNSVPSPSQIFGNLFMMNSRKSSAKQSILDMVNDFPHRPADSMISSLLSDNEKACMFNWLPFLNHICQHTLGKQQSNI